MSSARGGDFSEEKRPHQSLVFGGWSLVFFLRRVSPTFSVGGPCGMKEN
ncbi:MAG: hypothetical protein IM564_08130 [Chitinophagaceae bacterium]|nr:hypothetical protein [Chitinophagaceae bacterium]